MKEKVVVSPFPLFPDPDCRRVDTWLCRKKLNDGILIILGKSAERTNRCLGCARVRQHSFAHRGIQAVMPERVLVGDAHNFRVMNLELPAKKPGVPAGWFISRGSRLGSPGPLVMS